MRRWEVIFFLIAALVIGAFRFAGRIIEGKPAPQPTVGAGLFLSSGWYCPIPPGNEGSRTIATTNLGGDPVHLRRWGVSESKVSEFKQEDLQARRRSIGQVGDFGLADPAAVVEVFGAESTTDSLTVSGEIGVGSSRCSVQPSNRWYFGTGSTLRGRDTYLLVLNPFLEEAVLRIRFITSEADSVPARLRDFVVAKQSQTAVFLAEYFPETEQFGIDVTATRGRVVAARYQRVATRDGWKGMFSDVGIREPAVKWYLAGGEVPGEGEEYIRIVNPGEREALVQLIVHTETEQFSPPALQGQELQIPAGRVLTVKASEHLPRNFRHGTSVESTNGVPVIVERETFGSVAGGRGVDSVFGVPSIGRRWAVSVGSTAGGSSSLSITNFGSTRTLVRVALIGADGELKPPELAGVPVGAGLRATLDLTPFLAGGSATAIVEAVSSDISIEHHLFFADKAKDFTDQSGQPLE